MASEMLQHEKQIIAEPKLLLTQLRGDDIWIPCGGLDCEDDEEIFGTEKLYYQVVKNGLSHSSDKPGEESSIASIPKSFSYINNHHAVEADSSQAGADEGQMSPSWLSPDHDSQLHESNVTASDGASANEAQDKYKTVKQDLALRQSPTRKDTAPMENTEQPSPKTLQQDNDEQVQPKAGTAVPAEIEKMKAPHAMDVKDMVNQAISIDPEIDSHNRDRKADDTADATSRFDSGSTHEGELSIGKGSKPDPGADKMEDAMSVEGTNQVNEDEIPPPAHRMRTRAQAQAASEKTTSSRTRSASSASSAILTVHPLFLMPSSARPDRDFGLPPDEAEATRRILMSYIQKQEEVCRGAEKLYSGLLKVDRMRKTVLEWCKAEGHIGEMSDGEDWYDKEDWGLEEDLRKGHDDEEDDAATQHKKTRGRRA